MTMPQDPSATSAHAADDAGHRDEWFDENIKLSAESLDGLNLLLTRLKYRSRELKQTFVLYDRLLQSLVPLRIVGYCMLFLFLIDIGTLTIGAQLMNPDWEWNAYGKYVERSVILLLAIAIIYMGGGRLRSRNEIRLLRLVRWICLLAGLVYLLALPLQANNALRQHRDNGQALTERTLQVRDEQAAMLERLDAMDSVEALQAAARNTLPDASLAPAEGTAAVQTLKQQLAQHIQRNGARLEQQLRSAAQTKRNKLLQEAISWGAGGLISGLLLLYLWSRGRWTKTATATSRHRRKRRR